MPQTKTKPKRKRREVLSGNFNLLGPGSAGDNVAEEYGDAIETYNKTLDNLIKEYLAERQRLSTDIKLSPQGKSAALTDLILATSEKIDKVWRPKRKRMLEEIRRIESQEPGAVNPPFAFNDQAATAVLLHEVRERLRPLKKLERKAAVLAAAQNEVTGQWVVSAMQRDPLRHSPALQLVTPGTLREAEEILFGLTHPEVAQALETARAATMICRQNWQAARGACARPVGTGPDDDELKDTKTKKSKK